MITKQERQTAIELLMRGREILLDAVEGHDRGPAVMEAGTGPVVYCRNIPNTTPFSYGALFALIQPIFQTPAQPEAEEGGVNVRRGSRNLYTRAG